MIDKFVNALSIAETEIYDELISTLPQDEHQFSKKHNKKMKTLFLQMHGNKYHILNRSVKCIIIVAAIIAILAVASFAISPTRNFIIQTFEKYSSITFKSDSNSPKFVEEDIVCGYMPEGFVLSESSRAKSSYIKAYKNSDEFVTIRKLQKGSSYDLDTEDSNFEAVLINGMKYLVNSSNDQVYIIWSTYKFAYSVKSNLNKTEVIEIAKQIK